MHAHANARALTHAQTKDNQYLAASRSFGDGELKTPKPLVVCTPETKVFDITEVGLVALEGLLSLLTSQPLTIMVG